MKNITLDTVVDSPRMIANGQGAWRGTLSELLENATRYDHAGIGNLSVRMRDRGDLPETHDEDEEITDECYFDIDAHWHLITLEDIRDLCDDPNATIVK